MPNHRTPVAKAKVTGAAIKDPGRHAERSEPAGKSLGEASGFLDEHGQRAWEGFKRELPWLMESDRPIVEVCSIVRGELLSGDDVGVTRLSMYQSMLSKLGATPADRSRILMQDEEEADEFFN